MILSSSHSLNVQNVSPLNFFLLVPFPLSTWNLIDSICYYTGGGFQIRWQCVTERDDSQCASCVR